MDSDQFMISSSCKTMPGLSVMGEVYPDRCTKFLTYRLLQQRSFRLLAAQRFQRVQMRRPPRRQHAGGEACCCIGVLPELFWITG